MNPRPHKDPRDRAPRVVLASASPRRLELMAKAGYRVEVRACPVDEPTTRPGFIPVDLWPMCLAFIKARHVQAALKDPSAVVIGADTIVVHNGQILGKPRSKAHAREMLLTLSGQRHEVITGLAVLRGPAQRLTRAISVCKIKKLSRDWLNEYLATGKWMGKAGAYGIQDHDPFVTLVSGEWSNVVGLPMDLLKIEMQGLSVG